MSLKQKARLGSSRAATNQKEEAHVNILRPFKMGLYALPVVLGTMSAGSPAMADDSSIKIAVVTHGQSSDAYWGVVKKGSR